MNLPSLFFAPAPSTTPTRTPMPTTPLCLRLRPPTLSPPLPTARLPTPPPVPTSVSFPSPPITSPRARGPFSLAAPRRPARSPTDSRCPPTRRRRSTPIRRRRPNTPIHRRLNMPIRRRRPSTPIRLRARCPEARRSRCGSPLCSHRSHSHNHNHNHNRSHNPNRSPNRSRR